MREQDIGDVLVVDDDRLQGIVTDRDIVASRRPPAPLATAGRSAAPDTTGGSHRRQRERLEGSTARQVCPCPAQHRQHGQWHR
jgi:hypothetical protein